MLTQFFNIFSKIKINTVILKKVILFVILRTKYFNTYTMHLIFILLSVHGLLLCYYYLHYRYKQFIKPIYD